ncbi:hypothetical protein LR48_Vigan10g249500 [Vigna angularis]|uniref:Glycosyltransferase N-terminal domain-containing protein n=1 Tax=Phaseolus angularis TaxID=3914 RepID=A0A0L9VNS5_PHAAN|nr:hypothetical protein LR48_Vigan10g249500 [Vigna angularis]
MSNIPVVLVVPYPAQGHVNPLMILSQKLVENGCRVVFLNTEFDHRRVVSSFGEQQQHSTNHDEESAVKLVSVPDGLGADDDRNDLSKLCDGLQNSMPKALEKLIEHMHLKGDNRISFIVADLCMAWALDVGRKFGIKGAIVWPASAAIFALLWSLPSLIHGGTIDSDEWWLCNTTHELEPGALSFVPKLLPIGPLLRSYDSKFGITKAIGQFWEEDLSCMSWLDEQHHGTVLYVAFGSFTHFDQNQFSELALGLDLTNRPFLWVIREDNKMKYPHEFKGHKGKIVSWAPQQKVLSHPAIACFVTHCGWNSTIEGLSNGVPFLCWPYFADQIQNRRYICDELKVGLGFDEDQNGLVSCKEVKLKVDQILSDENTKSRSLELKEKVMNNIVKGGASLDNFNRFVKWLKQ